MRKSVRPKKRNSVERCPHCGRILPPRLHPPDGEIELTPRLKEVLIYIARGYTSPQIGEELKLSRRTVEFHRKLLMERLRVKTTAALTLYAAKKGFV